MDVDKMEEGGGPSSSSSSSSTNNGPPSAPSSSILRGPGAQSSSRKKTVIITYNHVTGQGVEEDVNTSSSSSGDEVEDILEVDEDKKRVTVAMGSPGCVAAAGAGGPPSSPSGAAMKKKQMLKALMVNQRDLIALRVDMVKEAFEIQAKYDLLGKALVGVRQAIVSGDYEPNEEDTFDKNRRRHAVSSLDDEQPLDFSPSTGMSFPAALGADDDSSDSDDDEVEDVDESMGRMVINESESLAAAAAAASSRRKIGGIPGFWGKAIIGCPKIAAALLEPVDHSILGYLTNVTVDMKPSEMAYQLCFYFAQNPFFANELLTKTVYTTCKVNQERPLAMSATDEAQPVKLIGCQIDWKSGQDVTKTLLRRTHKYKEGGTKQVTCSLQTDSFFNFFETIDGAAGFQSKNFELKAKMDDDFEMAELIRRRIIPHAMLYYNGDMERLEDMDFFDFDEDEDEFDKDDEGFASTWINAKKTGNGNGSGNKRSRGGSLLLSSPHMNE